MAHMQWISGTKSALIENITSTCCDGIFTTDHLENQFRKLRQGCGDTYFITVQQIMKKMAIQKTKICLRFDDGSLLNTTSNHGRSVHVCEQCSFIMTENMCTIFDN